MKKMMLFVALVALVFCVLTAHAANTTVIKNENLGVYTQVTYDAFGFDRIMKTVDVYDSKTGAHNAEHIVINYHQFFEEMKGC